MASAERRARSGRGPIGGGADGRAARSPGPALSEATGRKVDVKVVVDPSVIGGVVARVGDEVFDGSIANRLEDAKQALGSV